MDAMPAEVEAEPTGLVLTRRSPSFWDTKEEGPMSCVGMKVPKVPDGVV